MASRATGTPPAADRVEADQADTAQVVFGDTTAEVAAVSGTPAGSGSDTPTRRRFRRKHLVILCVVVLLATGAGLGLWLGTGTGSATPVKVVTQVVSVTTGNMQQAESTTGTIEPAQQADLDFAVSGQVTAVDVSVGQTVTAGEALATVAPTALQATADAAQASLTSVQARLASDQADGASTSQILSDEAAVTSAQSQVNSAQVDLADATLTSTIAGAVASVDLTVGQQVAGSGTGADDDPSSDTTSQVVVISTDSFKVNTTVDDTQVGKVAVGDQAVIIPTNATTRVYGTVGSVGQIASGSSGVASFPVVIDVTGTPSGLHAGASASVSIIVQQLDDVVEVPTAAITYDNGKATVIVTEGGRHVPTAIATGQTSDGYTQVTSGVKAGDKIVEKVVTFTGTPAAGKGANRPGAHFFKIAPGTKIAPGGTGGGGVVSVGGGVTGSGGGTGG